MILPGRDLTLLQLYLTSWLPRVEGGSTQGR